MSEIFSVLSKYIFAITLACAAFLGTSVAYLGSVLGDFFLQSQLKSSKDGRRNTARPSPAGGGQFVAFSEFEEIPSGNFIRDSKNLGADSLEGENQDVASNLVLRGVIAGSPRFARALIALEGSKEEAQAYGVGQVAGGHTIISIRRNYIEVERNGARFKVELGDAKGKQEVAASTGNANSLRKTISRTKLNKLLADQKELLRAKGGLFTLKGKIRGFKLQYVPVNHVFYQMGARSGDIIRRFNGSKLDSQDKLINIYAQLKTLNKASIDIERSGKIVSYEFIVNN